MTLHATLRQDKPDRDGFAWADGFLDPERNFREKWFWLPKSQVTDNGDGTITIPQWLQQKTGIGAAELARNAA